MPAPTLTSEQMHELASESSHPPIVQDQQGHRYVLLTESEYAQLRSAAEEEERDRRAWSRMGLSNAFARADEEP
jgi:hypothetical protein